MRLRLLALALGGSFAADFAHADMIQIGLNLAGLPPPGGSIVALDPASLGVGLRGFSVRLPDGIATLTPYTTAAQGIVGGSAPGLHQAPIVNQAGTPYAGAYFSTGSGAIDLAFTTPQRFLGLLWGSVDTTGENHTQTAPNTITFERNGIAVATVTGDDIVADEARLGIGGGNRGSVYALLNDTAGGFDEVLFTGGIASFEFAEPEVSASPVGLPVAPVDEPAGLAPACLALTGLLALGRRRA